MHLSPLTPIAVDANACSATFAIDGPVFRNEQARLLPGKIQNVANAVRRHVYPIHSVRKFLGQTHPHCSYESNARTSLDRMLPVRRYASEELRRHLGNTAMLEVDGGVHGAHVGIGDATRQPLHRASERRVSQQ